MGGEDLGVADLLYIRLGDGGGGGVDLKDRDLNPCAALDDKGSREADILYRRSDGDEVLPFRLEYLAGYSGLQPAAKCSPANILQPRPGCADQGYGDFEDQVDERDVGVGGRRSCGLLEKEDEIPPVATEKLYQMAFL